MVSSRARAALDRRAHPRARRNSVPDARHLARSQCPLFWTPVHECHQPRPDVSTVVLPILPIESIRQALSDTFAQVRGPQGSCSCRRLRTEPQPHSQHRDRGGRNPEQSTHSKQRVPHGSTRPCQHAGLEPTTLRDVQQAGHAPYTPPLRTTIPATGARRPLASCSSACCVASSAVAGSRTNARARRRRARSCCSATCQRPASNGVMPAHGHRPRPVRLGTGGKSRPRGRSGAMATELSARRSSRHRFREAWARSEATAGVLPELSAHCSGV